LNYYNAIKRKKAAKHESITFKPGLHVKSQKLSYTDSGERYQTSFVGLGLDCIYKASV